MMTCPECGGMVGVSAMVCPYCGAKGPAKRRKEGCAMAGCLIAVVLIVLLAWCL